MTQQDRTAVQYHKMTETPIPRLILSLAAPTILSMLITSIYNLADFYAEKRTFCNFPCKWTAKVNPQLPVEKSFVE